MVATLYSCRFSLMKRYFTRAPLQSTERPFLECRAPLLCGAAELLIQGSHFLQQATRWLADLFCLA